MASVSTRPGGPTWRPCTAPMLHLKSSRQVTFKQDLQQSTVGCSLFSNLPIFRGRTHLPFLQHSALHGLRHCQPVVLLQFLHMKQMQQCAVCYAQAVLAISFWGACTCLQHSGYAVSVGLHLPDKHCHLFVRNSKLKPLYIL